MWQGRLKYANLRSNTVSRSPTSTPRANEFLKIGNSFQHAFSFFNLPYRLLPVPLIIIEYELAQSVEGAIEGFALVHFGELANEFL